MKWIIPKTFTMVLLAIVLYETSANVFFFMLEGRALFEIHLWIWVFPISMFLLLAGVNLLLVRRLKPVESVWVREEG